MKKSSTKKRNRRKAAGVTRHTVLESDARDLSFIATESVHLICTSPPYADLIKSRSGKIIEKSCVLYCFIV